MSEFLIGCLLQLELTEKMTRRDLKMGRKCRFLIDRSSKVSSFIGRKLSLDYASYKKLFKLERDRKLII